MPLSVKKTAGATQYGKVFVGPIRDTQHVKVDISTLTAFEVDAAGYLKPGVPLTDAGILVGASPAYPAGVIPEAIKLPLATIPATNTTLAAETGDCLVAVGNGVVNRDIVEDNLGRALTANEIAGFARAGSLSRLTTT